MFNLFRKKNTRYLRYKQLFSSHERYVLTHKSDALMVCKSALQCTISTLDSHGFPAITNLTALVATIKPHDLYAMSESCFAKAESYGSDASERMAQGAILVGIYFGLAGLVGEGEPSAKGLFRRVDDLLFMSVKVAAKHHRRLADTINAELSRRDS